ncbi:MAG TPA: hypothetical protein VMI73_11555 [Trebonia sp.]|nr:hypothetical protein [Trebonia sp.]
MPQDVYFLTVRASPPGLLLHAPAGALAAAVITHARSFLHPDLPQPDGGRVYRCLTEAPGRTPGCLVALSGLDYELCGGPHPLRELALWELRRPGPARPHPPPPRRADLIRRSSGSTTETPGAAKA